MADDDFNPPSFEESDTDVRYVADRDTQTGEGTSQRRLPAPFRPGEIVGVFQLERLLGHGGSGSVFRALDTVSRRSCALKILTAPKRSDLRRNRIGFRRMMGLRHPNLMRVDQMHQIDGHLALSMEEIQGETLSKSRRRIRKLEQHIAHNKLLSLTRDYAAGLAAMHSNGILHRDIKPSNLMVDRNDRGRIIDYGLVGTFNTVIPSDCFRDYIAGTLRYIAPESYFEQKYTPAGDMFSLGLVILELLNMINGRRDWSRSEETRDEDAMLIHSAVDGLSEAIPDVLREACLEMLQINPADRPTAMQISRIGMPIGRSTVYMGGQELFGRQKEFEQVCEWLTKIYDGSQGRLHIHGDSGMGKTGLANAVESHLRSLRWGQVFRARCRPRENQPFQAFKQIIDEIANRYASNDRESLDVEDDNAPILRGAFPVLNDVLSERTARLEAKRSPDRTEVLQAVVNLSVELRKVGPLILIVDDVQWVDDDTSSILDALQTSGGGVLGIITISRNADSCQWHPPQATVRLNPVSDADGVKYLDDAAKRWGVNVPTEILRELSEAAGGNPFRLTELADEFRPSGQLHGIDPSESSIVGLGNLDRLWTHRFDRLSEGARGVLPLIATANCPVSIDQLATLSGSGDTVEIDVSELVGQRLVTDDATGGCCIQMIQDRISDGVIAQLTEAENEAAHNAWAELLRNDSDSEQYAGRIARHLLSAGRESETLVFVRQAALQAEQTFAFSEAAEWHLTVTRTGCAGDLSPHHTREAARCFVWAGQPAKAADLHVQLANSVEDPSEQMRHRLLATELFVRSGRFHQVQEDLSLIVDELGLPSQNAPRSLSLLGIRFSARIRQLFQPRPPKMDAIADVPGPDEAQTLAFSQGLIRPLMMFDANYAGQLYLYAAKLVDKFGALSDRVSVAIGSGVFACSDHGSRSRGEALLRDLQASATDLGPKIAGDYWAAKSLSSAFAMNWSAVPKSVKAAVDSYSATESQASEFEIGNVRWLSANAQWYLGDWDSMQTQCRKMLDDALQRDDRAAHVCASSGLSAAAWLGLDQEPQWQAIDKRNDLCTRNTGQVVDLFRFVAGMQVALYRADFRKAVQLYESFSSQPNKLVLPRIQYARILTSQFGVLAALHMNETESNVKWQSMAKAGCDRLRAEQVPCSVMLADLYRGILARQTNDTAEARKRLVSAKQLGKELELMPFQLAAEDALQSIENSDAGLLRHRMQNRGIICPDSFERLYTVACSKQA